MHKVIQLAFLPLLFFGCGFDSGVPPVGFDRGMSLSDRHDIEYIKRELTAQKAEFELYESGGQQHLAFQKENEELVNEVYLRAMRRGAAPIGYTGLCSETKQLAEHSSTLLAENGIPTIVQQSDVGYCWYWPEEFTEKVAEIDNAYEQIRSHQESSKNDT